MKLDPTKLEDWQVAEAAEKFGDTIIAALRGDKEPREDLESLAEDVRAIIDEDPFNAMTLGVEEEGPEA